MESIKQKRMRAVVKPELLKWARQRAGLSVESLLKDFPGYIGWEKGESYPTLKQLERLSRKLHVPLGVFFLKAPPSESLPIPDFRTVKGRKLSRPSPELLETIYICQQRQEWYRNYLISVGESPLPFVGTATIEDDIISVAEEIRGYIRLDSRQQSYLTNWTQALRILSDKIEQIGVLVMINGVVGNNTHRKLKVEEFRGFVLVDNFAPLIFINGSDTLSGKIFTLFHELAHIWLGESGITDASLQNIPEDKVERWCNQVAAEVLVPMHEIRKIFNSKKELTEELNRIARIFKVSTLVILRRLFDAGFLDRNSYQATYSQQLERLKSYEKPTSEGGGNFYHNLIRRVSKRFAVAVISSALEGQTLFRDAFNMLGISKIETLKKVARELRLA